MPATPPYQITWYSQSGVHLQQIAYVEEAGQTFREGDTVGLNAAGRVIGIGSPGALLTSASLILGIAGKTASNLAAPSTDPVTGLPFRNIPVTMLNADALGVAPVNHAVAASAVTSQSQQGKSYQLRLNPAGQIGGVQVAIDQTVTPVAQVTRLTGQYGEGEQYGTVEFSPLVAALQIA